MLQVCTEELGWCWSDPICIDNEGTITRTIETSDNRATLIIRIKQMTNCQKQVGYSCIDHFTHIKFGCKKPRHSKTYPFETLWWEDTSDLGGFSQNCSIYPCYETCHLRTPVMLGHFLLIVDVTQKTAGVTELVTAIMYIWHGYIYIWFSFSYVAKWWYLLEGNKLFWAYIETYLC